MKDFLNQSFEREEQALCSGFIIGRACIETISPIGTESIKGYLRSKKNLPVRWWPPMAPFTQRVRSQPVLTLKDMVTLVACDRHVQSLRLYYGAADTSIGLATAVCGRCSTVAGFRNTQSRGR